ncbi:MAG: recombinase family protein [Eggerthellaceae bacterium]|nr:recombinase family protein [Eggerthellaceae bacterium]
MRQQIGRVAIYCRTARYDDDAIAQQEILLRLLAEERGYTHLEIFIDNGVSGLSFNRPALAELEKCIASGEVTAILVTDISRIGRDLTQTIAWIRECFEKGTEVIDASGSYPRLPSTRAIPTDGGERK